VEPHGRGYLDTPGLHTPAQQRAWTAVAAAVHARGGRIFAQLWHVGRVSHASLLPGGASPLGPTSVAVPGLSTFALRVDGSAGAVAATPPRAMDRAQIAATIAHFACAARHALAAGFDGIEILAANGYLFDQFQNSVVNTRTDAYGGRTPADRARLLLDTVDALREETGAARIGVRLSPFGRFNEMPHDPQTRATYLHIADELERRRITYCHFNDEPASPGHLNAGAADDAPATAFAAPPQSLIPPDFHREFRAHFRGPVLLCGGMNAARAEEALRRGLADCIAFGLPYVANPDLVERMRQHWPLSVADPTRFYGGDARGYTDYPPYLPRLPGDFAPE